MAEVFRDLNIDCTKDDCVLEKVTGYEHGVKVFHFKPLNGGIDNYKEIDKNTPIPNPDYII